MRIFRVIALIPLVAIMLALNGISGLFFIISGIFDEVASCLQEFIESFLCD